MQEKEELRTRPTEAAILRFVKHRACLFPSGWAMALLSVSLLRITEPTRTSSYVRKVPILLQKSKIECPPKCREGRFLAISSAARVLQDDTTVCGRFCTKRCGPHVAACRECTSGPEKIRSSAEKDFCNSICQYLTAHCAKAAERACKMLNLF